VVEHSVEVTRTYLEMTDPGQLVPARTDDLEVRVERAWDCPPSFHRYLYAEVGAQYQWVDRLVWNREQTRRHLADPAVSIWVLWVRGSPGGYFELKRGEDSVEVAYFGLLPEFTGRGLGKHLLTAAVEAAWSFGPRRVWLHTCTLDHPAALPNYVARGFRPYKSEVYLSSNERHSPPAHA
jgi:GNAT superfamily N-acetyltransferase